MKKNRIERMMSFWVCLRSMEKRLRDIVSR
jgi:hypothetical protein